MDLITAASIVLGALRDVFTPNTWLVALWLLSALSLAALLVYTWQRLLRR